MSHLPAADALPNLADPLAEAVAIQIEATGYAILPDFLDRGLAAALLGEGNALRAEGAFQRAAVGRGKRKQLRAELRTDQVYWLDAGSLTVPQQAYWERMNALRLVLNRMLFLGLFEFEAHHACFLPGGFYKPHRDRHRSTRTRVLSTVVYLDEDWQEQGGGQLRLFTNRATGVAGPFLDVFPEAGKLAIFLSDEVWHEVRVSSRARHSITGWFRRREEPLSLPGLLQ